MRRSRDSGLTAALELRLDGSRLPSCAVAGRLDCGGGCVSRAPAHATVRLRLVDTVRVWSGAGGGDHSFEPGGAVLCGGKSDFWLVRHNGAQRLRSTWLVGRGPVSAVDSLHGRSRARDLGIGRLWLVLDSGRFGGNPGRSWPRHDETRKLQQRHRTSGSRFTRRPALPRSPVMAGGDTARSGPSI